MNTHQAVHLGNNLEVVRDGIANVQGAIVAALLRNGQQLVDFLLADAHLGGHFRQAAVRLVARLVDDADVEEVLLRGKQLAAKGPELLGGEAQDSEARLVRQRRRRVPRLDLLAEDDGEAVGPGGSLAHDGEDLGGERVEDFGGKGTGVVEEDLEGVSCARDGRR